MAFTDVPFSMVVMTQKGACAWLTALRARRIVPWIGHG
jgi:hypothetical protein